MLKTKHPVKLENCFKIDTTDQLVDKDVQGDMKGTGMEGLKDPPKITSLGDDSKNDKAKYFDENLCCFEEKFDHKPVIHKNVKRRMVQSG